MHSTLTFHPTQPHISPIIFFNSQLPWPTYHPILICTNFFELNIFQKRSIFFDHLSTLFNCWSKLVIWSKSRQMAFRYSSPWEKRSSIFWWLTSFAITWEIYLKTCSHFLHHYQEHKLGTTNMSPTQCSKFNLCLQQDVARTATTSLNN